MTSHTLQTNPRQWVPCIPANYVGNRVALRVITLSMEANLNVGIICRRNALTEAQLWHVLSDNVGCTGRIFCWERPPSNADTRLHLANCPVFVEVSRVPVADRLKGDPDMAKDVHALQQRFLDLSGKPEEHFLALDRIPLSPAASQLLGYAVASVGGDTARLLATARRLAAAAHRYDGKALTDPIAAEYAAEGLQYASARLRWTPPKSASTSASSPSA